MDCFYGRGKKKKVQWLGHVAPSSWVEINWVEDLVRGFQFFFCLQINSHQTPCLLRPSGMEVARAFSNGALVRSVILFPVGSGSQSHAKWELILPGAACPVIEALYQIADNCNQLTHFPSGSYLNFLCRVQEAGYLSHLQDFSSAPLFSKPSPLSQLRTSSTNIIKVD